MSKVYETGHAKNVANFETLISFVASYGATYNPSRASIQLAALQTKAAAASTAMHQVNTLLATNGNVIAARETTFEPLKKLSTRLLNALKATDVAKPVVDNLASLNRKIQGKRAGTATAKKEASTPNDPVVDPTNSPVKISTSQQSFDSMLDTFQKQVELLASLPQYAPNETELQVATLQNLYTKLKMQNAAVINSSTDISNARLSRNETMYHAENGLVATAADVKNYVKSVYGASSPQFKQISSLSFKALPL